MNQGDRDEALLAQLGAAVAEDGPPPEIVAAAKAAFTWRTIDAELAALAYDTLEESVPAGVRGASASRALTFEAGSAVIEIEVESAGEVRRLEGQVVPAAVARLELHRVDGAEPMGLAIDELGRFRADGVRPGQLRLLCRFLDQAGGATLLTEWVRI